MWVSSLCGAALRSALFHFQIITVVVASPCRATALSQAARLDINDVEMELGVDSVMPLANGRLHKRIATDLRVFKC